MTKPQDDIPEQNAVSLRMDDQITACTVSGYAECNTELAPNAARVASDSGRRKFKSGLSLTEKFWSQVAKTEQCWLWHGPLDAYGYGQMFVPELRRPVKAHRLAWMWLREAITSAQHVLHRCDVRNCVNPDHLFLGDQAANMKDAAAKGRLHVSRPNARGRFFSAAHRAALAVAARRRHARTKRQVA